MSDAGQYATTSAAVPSGPAHAELGCRGSGAHAVQAAGERALPHRDPERLGALLAQLEPRMIAVALRFTRDPDTARDVVQNGFEKVIRHGASFRGQARVSTWVHRIVCNEALMWLRRQRRRAELQTPADENECAVVADGAPGPAEAFDRRQRAQRLRQGITQLSREERDVMLRCGLAGQSYAEYSAQTGTRLAAVKSRAFRARRRLHALLREA